MALTGALDRPFLGVRLVTGRHCDAEGGAGTDGLCTATSGAPQAKNVPALQTLAVGWATYFPGGASCGAGWPPASPRR